MCALHLHECEYGVPRPGVAARFEIRVRLAKNGKLPAFVPDNFISLTLGNRSTLLIDDGARNHPTRPFNNSPKVDTRRLLAYLREDPIMRAVTVRTTTMKRLSSLTVSLAGPPADGTLITLSFWAPILLVDDGSKVLCDVTSDLLPINNTEMKKAVEMAAKTLLGDSKLVHEQHEKDVDYSPALRGGHLESCTWLGNGPVDVFD